VAGWSGYGLASFTPTTSSFFDAQNRMIGFGAHYDDAGNQDAIGAYQFHYDAENRLKDSTINSVTTTYEYDGEGRRVKKTAGGAVTVFVYDALGRLAAEYASAPPLGSGTQYATTDHLGSVRVMTKADDGAIVSLHDYQPFGEEIPAGVGGRTSLWGAVDNASQRFTGKERDGESGLDYFDFRYYSGAQGRFTSPDPLMASANVADPQSWNRYDYARNNPLRYNDPLGLYPSPAYN
jgi:RHS repeat-associated protein